MEETNYLYQLGKKKSFRLLVLALLIFLFSGCKSSKKTDPIFEVLDNKKTGLDFVNKLTPTLQFNMFSYMYFYNGGGVGAGDFNNDGLIDLFFGSNQQQNKIYLNKGHLSFKDITTEAAIPQNGGWSTGISVVDINNDGVLDIYVCRVGQYETLHSKNQLLINQGLNKNGIPTFIDKAKEYGLDFSGFSTQAAFFDYDLDGDLDMFLLNHSVHENGTFRPRNDFIGTYHPLAGDRIFRNEGSIFTDVTRQTGINSTAIGYGLGIAIADINLDGYPDIYIGNDFHENDYLYINQKNGTFKEEGEKQLMHTSKFSMGVDVADINNDALPEIISMDMLPPDPYSLKRSSGENTYDVFADKIKKGYSYQYTRNNLQYNRGNDLFSEVGLYSNVAATDWSWAPLWLDFDNDGLKDLFISNGIPKRLNDIDYIDFVSNGEVQQRINENNRVSLNISLLDKFPEIKIRNKFFKNKGSLSFEDEENAIEHDEPTFSSGSAYADFDNDGDLDIVVNNINEAVLLYENKSRDTAGKTFLKVRAKGPEKNIFAIGSRLILFSNNEVRSYENHSARGFMSSMVLPLQAGLKNTKVDSAYFIWPDNSFQKLPTGLGIQDISYRKGLPQMDWVSLANHINRDRVAVEDISSKIVGGFLHRENNFIEFDRESLIPHMLSTEGPALAVADINNDGLEDFFIGSARDKKSAIFLQNISGDFIKMLQPDLENDSSYEEVGACWTDVNKDGLLDLVVASGGNEFYGLNEHNSPRVYLNGSNGRLTRLQNAFTNLYVTASCVIPYDLNNDGYEDLFIGARTIPWEYGQVPRSYLLLNNKKGKFIDVTDTYAPDLATLGFVTNAVWFDIDGDGDKDLLPSLEWGSIIAFINTNGKLVKKELSGNKGWWNFILPFDMDNDGDIDLVAGNLGLNSRLKASVERPVRLYYNDFDDNGKKEQVLTYYVGEKEIPFASKAELEKQMPVLKKKFLYAADFAKASLSDLLGNDKLKSSVVLTANFFSNALLINKGNLTYEIKSLPWQAQLSSFKTASALQINNSNLPDVLLMGNYYDSKVEMGRYDADFGTVLVNKGNNFFACEQFNGLNFKGQVRNMAKIVVQNKPAYILAVNNDSVKLIRFSNRQP